jgi:hypothetical protein
MSSSPLRKRLPSVICHSKKDRHCEEVRRSNLSLHASLSTTIETPPQSYISFEERPSLRGGKTKQSFINMHLYLPLWKRLPLSYMSFEERPSLRGGTTKQSFITCISIYHYGNASPQLYVIRRKIVITRRHDEVIIHYMHHYLLLLKRLSSLICHPMFVYGK